LQGQGLIELGLESGAPPQEARGDIALSLQIDRAAASSPEGQELHKLALDPANLTYRLAAAASGGGGKNIAVKTRSILAAMRFLSKGIDVPDVDVRGGLVPVLRDAAGVELVWATLLGDSMHILSSETWSASAYVRVFHNGHWFYIDNADLISKQSFALQAGEVPPITAILTLPISR
jgi:hypothetical protein